MTARALFAAFAAQVGKRKVDSGVGLSGAQLHEPGQLLLGAVPTGAGAVGVQEGVPGQSEQVMSVGERQVGRQVVRVAGVLQQSLVDLA